MKMRVDKAVPNTCSQPSRVSIASSAYRIFCAVVHALDGIIYDGTSLTAPILNVVNIKDHFTPP